MNFMDNQCKLCKRHPIELQDSHYIPAGIYRELRDKNYKNPNPKIITSKKSFQSSWQQKAKLLCSSCEQLISSNGENWTLKQILKANGTFGMRSILSSHKPSLTMGGNETKIFYASEIPGIDIKALTYFASSVFWRGSIHPWNMDKTIPVMLGPYEEHFRQYLLGNQGYPENCYLIVAVRQGTNESRITYPPLGKRDGCIHYYKFPIPGFAFTLIIGKSVSSIHRKLCFATQPQHPIIYTSVIEEMLESEVKKLLIKQNSRDLRA